MKTSDKISFVILLSAAFCFAAEAEILDRPSGIKIGERLTLRPYVSMSLTYDSNVNGSSDSVDSKKGDFMWTISPTLSLHYNAENWSLLLSGYYNYHSYFERSNRGDNHHNYGEDLRWNWSNSSGAEKGWSIILGQSFRQITPADDMVLADGQNYDSGSKQFQFSAAVQRRFNEHWHGDANASYYWLNYDNNTGRRSSAAYYGWDRVLVGAEAGFAPSPWTDFLLTGSYQYYNQDNVDGSSYGGNSQGCSVQGGIGSYMTDRISYRLLAGWSQFNYAGGESKANGFVYTASGNWKIGETWNTMLLASSYYQPSERQHSSQSRVDAVSWGIAKSMVRGKLRATFDIRYRHETQESVENSNYDYNLNIWTGRLGVDYTLCRFLALYAYGEYQNSLNDESDRHRGAYDYDRWRVTVGFRVQY